MKPGLSLLTWSLLPLAALLSPVAASAQSDSVTVIAGAHYEAGGLKGALLGRDYRDLWTTPIRVPVLDLDSFAGGLTPVERGSGLQTTSLRFLGADGREYNFRSVDKDQTGGLHPDFQNTTVDRVAQDQVSSKHPAAAAITGPLLDAAGVLHPDPALYVMPDVAALGEFRETFAGMLGMMEVHPNEVDDDTPGFAGADRIADAETLLDHLEESAEHRVDSREYLRARLMDLLVGDWDRHLGQWRWARFDRDGGYRWVPVPEDRDNALSSYDGLLLGLARSRTPHLNAFTGAYPTIFGLVRNAQPLDREILSDLPREEYVAMAAELQRRLPDDVIARAVESAPVEYHALRGSELERELRARRDALPAAAAALYALVAREVDVRATDEADHAVAVLAPDGSLELELSGGLEEEEGGVYFRRRFVPGETREVRVYLRGADDDAVVRGQGGGGVRLRLIGGGGDDVLADSSAGAAGRVLFYDDRGDNQFLSLGATPIDRREFVEPEAAAGGFNENAPAYQDWGQQVQWFRPSLEWRYNVGPVVGGGPQLIRYGFRRAPYARRVWLRGLYAPLHTRFGIDLAGEVRHTNAPSYLTFSARATQLPVTRFHGFGNESDDVLEADEYKVWEQQLYAGFAYHRQLTETLELHAGPFARYRDPETPEMNPAAVAGLRGVDSHTDYGLRVGAVLDSRDLPSYPRRGLLLSLETTAAGATEGVGSYGGADAQGSAYLPLPFPLETTLAVRAGGEAVFGEFPFQEAAFLGGSGTLRGTPRQRFAGDAAAWAGAELRTFLTRFNFISRGDLGLIALADAGRVFVDGESSDRIHTGFGGGLWVGILDRTRTASLVFASGTEEALYFTLGMPF